MDWWNSFLDWTRSSDGWRIMSGAVIPFVAIVVAGVIAALIGRGATKRVITLQERESKNAAVGGVISAARKAATWGSLGHDERSYTDHLAEDADIRLRLLAVPGAAVAANWAQHEIADIKRNSSTFSFQAEQSLGEFRDRMLEWQARPSRARKLFRSDLERWKFESPDPDTDLVQRQQQWNADQAGPGAATPPSGAGAPGAGTTPSSVTAVTPTTTSLRPAAQPTTPIAGAATSGAPERSGGTPAVRSAAPVLGSVADREVPSSGGFGSDASRPVDASAHANAAGATKATDRRSIATDTDTTDTTATDTDTTDTDTTDETDTTGGPTGTDETTSRGGAPLGSRPIPSTGTGRSDSDVDRATANADSAVQDPDGDATSSGQARSGRGSDDATVRPGADRPEPTVAAGTDPGHTTTSVLPRVDDAPTESAGPDQTDEAPYASPLSATELRRRAEEDDE